MINKINNNQISNILKDLSAKPVDAGRTSETSRADASLQVSYEALIQKAQAEPAANTDAVAKARQMILSGELDTPENIRQAAENLAKYGV